MAIDLDNPENNINDDFPKRWLKKLSPEFMDGVQSMDTEEVKKKIVECEGNIYEAEKALLADEKLIAAKQLVKDLSESNKDLKTSETAKIKYLLFTLESRGVAV